VRRSRRSTIVPANNPKTMSGNACAIPTAPVQTGLRVASHTWKSTATRVNWLPNTDAVCPNQRRR
jgi:hypothetical protein